MGESPMSLMRTLTRRGSLLSLLALALCFCTLIVSAACSKSSSSPTKEKRAISKKTNVVMVIIDTLRADVLGCCGYGADTSPELDDFARQGVIFKRTVANCSWTRPSIGTMVASLHGRTLGIYDEHGDMLADEVLTLAEVLQDEGYTTIGVTANPNINTSFGFNQGFDHYQDSRRLYSGLAPAERRKAQHRTTREVFRAAMDAMGPTPKPPYYMQLNIMEMHGGGPPLRPEYIGRFDGKVRKGHERYAAALRQVSVDIKEFVDELTAMPGMDDTLFIITSDHGQGLTDHPAIPKASLHGFVLYESNVMVPLIFYHHLQGIGGREVNEKVQLLDLAPTILGLLGVAIPEPMEGLSLETLITGQGPKPALPEYIVTETLFRKNDKLGVYSDSWKYFENLDGHEGTAPREIQAKGINENGAATNQLADHGAEAAKMEAYLRKWEAAHPKTKAIHPKGGLSKEMIEQLKALGYFK
jgi:arylsulfatase A-like enzyme